MITLLAAPSAFEGTELTVEGDAYRHLFRARRAEVGDPLRVVDGKGRARWAEVVKVDRKAARVSLGDPAPAREPAFRLELLVATLRPERASWLVEKATEVGVSAIRFLNSVRAPRHFGDGTVERLVRVAASAVEQCHRSLLPEITGPHRWEEISRLTAGVSRRWVLDTATELPLPRSGGGLGRGLLTAATEDPSPALPALPRGEGALLVGPEGGWAPEERSGLLAAGWIPVGLGERALRTETAAVAGSSLVLLGSGFGVSPAR